MMIGITQFLPQNIPQPNAAGLGIYDGDNKICDVDVSRMYPTDTGKFLYPIGLISDSHLQPESSYGAAYAKQLDDALAWLKRQRAAMVCHSGDVTDHGFYYSNKTLDLNQFGQYKKIREKYPDMPIYVALGNHDSYFGDYTVAANRELLIEYAGHDVHHTVAKGGDLYIFCGQTVNYLPMSYDTVTWLESTLSNNTDKRCFVFCHPYIGSDDSGNPLGLAGNPLWNGWAYSNRVQTALRNHPRAMLFHGHSHARPENQFADLKTNYSDALGFPSFHIPSSAYCRKVVDGVWKEFNQQSVVYLADVYERAVVLRAYDVVEGKYVAIGQYCIKF